jgi:predicted Zn-dependent protease
MTDFRSDADVDLPAIARAHGLHCRCALHGRRLFTGALLALPAAGALAQQPQQQPQPQPRAERIEECKRSSFTKVVSAGQIEQAAGQQYAQMLQQAGSKKALGPADHPQVRRLRAIAERIIPYTQTCNAASKDWKWEVNLIGSQDLNAFCMPGGKIAFYYGILAKLQLDDDEVAMIMGHEMAHALLEHARERMGKTMATRGVLEIGSALLGLGDLGRMAGGMGAQLLTLRFSRDDESEADALGLVLGAKAGYNPQAGVSLWQKMMGANKGAPPQWLSTHPSGKTRIKDMQDRMPRVQPMYAAAAKPAQRFAPPELKSATPASASAPVR